MQGGSDEHRLKCVIINELFDYYPLPAYSVNGLPHIALKHAIHVNV